MGLLRAYADAVIIGTSSLREDANHLHIPAPRSLLTMPMPTQSYVYAFRQARHVLPISVIMTASGDINFEDKTFHTPGLKAVIVTTEQGQDALRKKTVPQGVDIHVVTSPTSSESGVSPADALTSC